MRLKQGCVLPAQEGVAWGKEEQGRDGHTAAGCSVPTSAGWQPPGTAAQPLLATAGQQLPRTAGSHCPSQAVLQIPACFGGCWPRAQHVRDPQLSRGVPPSPYQGAAGPILSPMPWQGRDTGCRRAAEAAEQLGAAGLSPGKSGSGGRPRGSVGPPWPWAWIAPDAPAVARSLPWGAEKSALQNQ